MEDVRIESYDDARNLLAVLKAYACHREPKEIEVAYVKKIYGTVVFEDLKSMSQRTRAIFIGKLRKYLVDSG